MSLTGGAASPFGAVGNRLRAKLVRLPFSWAALGAMLVGAMLAKWCWIMFSPREVAVAVAARQPTASADNLFGAAAVPNASAPLTATLPNMRLAGVFAGTPGFAILELEGNKQIGVAVGGEIKHGLKLAEVATDHVVVENGGLRQRIDLPAPRAGTGAIVQTAAPQPTARTTPEATHQTSIDAATAAAIMDKLPAWQRGAFRHQLSMEVTH